MTKTYSLKRLATLRSHAAHARFNAEIERDTGFLARCQVEDIPSPYAYSPSKIISRWRGKDVVCFETAHRCYEIFEVHPELLRFKTDQEATDWHIRFCRKGEGRRAMTQATLKFASEDNGNCRVYYRKDKRLYCWQLASRGRFEFYICSSDGEPSHEVGAPEVTPNPSGETAIGRELAEFLNMRRALKTSTIFGE